MSMNFKRKIYRHGRKTPKKHTEGICPRCGYKLDIKTFYEHKMYSCFNCGYTKQIC